MANAIIVPGADFSANKLATVTFEAVPCTGISLSSNAETFTEIGDTATIVATLTPLNTTDRLTWATSNSSVAIVTNGVITAVSAGNATITATCGEQTATVSVLVTAENPSFVVVGGFNARLGSGGVYNECVYHADTPGKHGIIVANSSDTNLKTWDRSGQGEYEGDFRFVPIQIPTGAKRIKLEYVGNGSINFKTRFLFCDSTTSPSGYVGVKCVDGKGNSQYDQENNVTEYTATIPDISGLDSFGIYVNVNDYALYWNTDNTDMFEITYLYTDA